MGKYLFTVFVLAGFFASAALAAPGDEEDIKTNRPGNGEAATVVEFMVFVLDIDDISGAEQNFTTNVYLSLKWKDRRLIHEGGTETKDLEEVWNPRIMISNRQGLVRKSFLDTVEVRTDGTVTYRQQYVGSMSQPLRLSEFPFDKHTFAIQFLAPGYNPEEVKFVPGRPRETVDIVGGGIYKELSVADWKILDYLIEPRPYIPFEDVEVAGFVFEFTAKRYILYYIWQVIVPLMFIVIMSWGAFWIDPTNAGAQIGVATSSMLTLIAYRFMLGNLIPRLPYMTRLDYFLLGSTSLVFLTLVEVVVTSHLARSSREKLGRKLDRISRLVFPITFILWSTWSLAT